MRIRLLLVSLTVVFFANCTIAQNWKPAGDKIMTVWGENLDTENILPEYPRPIMERALWQNLNGFWNYKIQPKNSSRPVDFDGEILVPFAIESALSGVGKEVGPDNELWYQRTFTVPQTWKGKRVLLHFGAVDWKATVYVNDILVGSHTGGYTSFSFDVTDALIKGDNVLCVKVFDSTNKGYQPCGKQTTTPKSIWYTAVTGIWQTLWLEPVAEKHICDLKITPDIDRGILSVDATTNCVEGIITVSVYDGQNKVATAKSLVGAVTEVAISEVQLWSPAHPFLYDLEVTLYVAGKQQDMVSGYAAMRKISVINDKDGIQRMALNNEVLFQMGTLDQGWWPDGLYTAPTDEAQLFDIQQTKDMGFNMIRKHVKVEPQRWYYHCDRLGMLVWQDMPSGDMPGGKWHAANKITDKDSKERTPQSAAQYRKEWKEIIDMLYSYPSIIMWVPFNESWGQFESVSIAEWTKCYDSSRLLNIASGGNLFRTGDIIDVHHYPEPRMYVFDSEFVNVLGEYGGIGLSVPGHLWHQDSDTNWGYITSEDTKAVTDKYVSYGEMLYQLIKRGFSAAVYTQTTDVESEINGLMTYDRKVVKVDQEEIKKINDKLTSSLTDKEE